ncbi:spermidine synthase [Bradyrhizobium sp. i1.8.4]|uniref:spermidine synthase n=1 Tax=unclassified Bradyrhizobium TaxID=2631580 RepID=UPI003D22B92B
MPATKMAEGLNQQQVGFNLFLVGFLILFLELACIRWFSAKVVFLQFFTNIVLLAAFLGMSCGCLAARRTTNWLALFPGLALVTFAAVATIMVLYSNWGQFAVDVGHQASPQEVFFGTEYRNPDLAKFVVPIEAIAGLFFVLIALMFVGLGQTLGRAFDAYPNRVAGYSLNIGGSLAGIIGFSLLSFAQAPPVVWFGISCTGIVYLLYQDKALSILRLATIIIVVGFTAFYTDRSDSHDIRWSPYYAVDLNKSNGVITVNSIGHQEMMPFSERGSSYSLIHLLQKHSGGAPFKDVMIIGAGSGNDLAHALRFGVERIDAVEIDPVIQNIGIHNHPDKPYQDPRVMPHLDDGRHFLRTTERKYDLVVYALVDSLILHSGYANIRLESYLFTEQAFQDVRRVLKQDGVFVMYNYYRQGWIVQRVAEMAKQVFGCDPLVLPLPYKETLTSSEAVGFTTIIAGCNPRISTAFRDRGKFWLNSLPPENLSVNGFDKAQDKGQDKAAAQRGDWVPLAPAKLVVDNEGARQSTSDDWPFLYVSGRLIPDLTVRSMVLLGVLGLGLVYLFKPKGAWRPNNRMFFLGAAFMLLETKAVVQMALLFGSTWVVNSAVFFTALLLILAANLYVIKVPSTRLVRHYAGLLALLAVSVLVPLDTFLSGGIVWRYMIPCALALGPMFFAGVIFARSFRDEANPDQAFGSNIAGSVIGGLAESCSTLLGFRYLLLVAIGFYLLSAWMPSRKG